MSQDEINATGQFHSRLFRVFLTVVLFGVALVARMPHFTDPPLDFFGMRQYHSAIIARGMYLKQGGEGQLPSVQRQAGIAAAESRDVVEPRIAEWVSARLYGLAGGEKLWIPRLLSVMFWLGAGAVVLWLVAAWYSFPVGLVCTGYFLLVPYGVSASRSFQPDPMMMFGLVSTLALAWAYTQKRTTGLLVAAGLVAGLTILVKATAVFFVFAAFLWLTLSAGDGRRRLATAENAALLALALLPSLVYYGLGLLVLGFLKGNAEGSWLLDPRILLSSGFWQLWRCVVQSVVGFGALCLALLGLLINRDRVVGTFLVFLWVAYFVFGLVFDYHIHTHSYYSLPLILIVALSMAPFLAAIERSVLAATGQRWRRFALLGLGLLSLRLAVFGSNERLRVDPSIVRDYAQIGVITKHSSRVICLGRENHALFYEAWISGWSWPNYDDQYRERIGLAPHYSAKERYASLFAGNRPAYFVVSSPDELEKQPDLKALLDSRFRVIARTPTYAVYSLTAERDAPWPRSAL